MFASEVKVNVEACERIVGSIGNRSWPMCPSTVAMSDALLGVIVTPIWIWWTISVVSVTVSVMSVTVSVMSLVSFCAHGQQEAHCC